MIFLTNSFAEFTKSVTEITKSVIDLIRSELGIVSFGTESVLFLDKRTVLTMDGRG
jgi:hypothetical protein